MKSKVLVAVSKEKGVFGRLEKAILPAMGRAIVTVERLSRVAPIIVLVVNFIVITPEFIP